MIKAAILLLKYYTKKVQNSLQLVKAGSIILDWCSVLVKIFENSVISMILTQILEPECIKAPLESTDKESVIRELVDVLAAEGLLLDRDAVLNSVMMREQTRSTGIGSGIAIPHGKSAGVKELVMSIGITTEPLEFESIDGKGVTIVILLASPLNKTGPHIQALARISRLLLDSDFKSKLENAGSGEIVYELISSKENE
jgi:fructose-specific phosphotransferase system IIA component